MVRTGFAILTFFIISKDKGISPRNNLQPYLAGYFRLYFKVLEDKTDQSDSDNNF